MLDDEKNPDPDRDLWDARAEDQSRGKRRGSWLDTDALNAERAQGRRRARLRAMIRAKDRRGVASALRALGLSETDPLFVEIWRAAFGSSPSQARDQKP